MVYGVFNGARLFCILSAAGCLIALHPLFADAQAAHGKQPRISVPADRKGDRLTAVHGEAQIAPVDIEERIELAFAAVDVPPEGVDVMTTSSVGDQTASRPYVAPLAPRNWTAGQPDPNPERFRSPDYHLASVGVFPGFVSLTADRLPEEAAPDRSAVSPKPDRSPPKRAETKTPDPVAKRADTAPKRAALATKRPKPAPKRPQPAPKKSVAKESVLPLPPSLLPSRDR